MVELNLNYCAELNQRLIKYYFLLRASERYSLSFLMDYWGVNFFLI